MISRRAAVCVAGLVLAGCSGGGASPTATPSLSNGVTAFCSVYRSELTTIRNAGTEPKGAVTAYDRIIRVAPAAIADDVDYVDSALHAYVEHDEPGDPAKVQQASTTITRYYSAHCG